MDPRVQQIMDVLDAENARLLRLMETIQLLNKLEESNELHKQAIRIAFRTDEPSFFLVLLSYLPLVLDLVIYSLCIGSLVICLYVAYHLWFYPDILVEVPLPAPPPPLETSYISPARCVLNG